MKEKVYSWLDTVQKSAKEAKRVASGVGYMAGKKAEKLATAAKLNAQILSKQREIQKAYQDVGKLMYNRHIGSDAEPDAALMEKLQALDALHMELAEMEKETGRVTVIRTCPTCGAELRNEDGYCRECGERLKTEDGTK